MSAAERPNLVDLFTPIVRKARSVKPLESLAWVLYCEGVHIAAVPAKLIDGSSRGIAGWVARTTPKRASRQADPITWVGFLRVKVAAGHNASTVTVYHVGTGGPLFATRQEAGESARTWRFGTIDAEQKTLLDVGGASAAKPPTGAQKALVRRLLKGGGKPSFADKKRLPRLVKAGWLNEAGALTEAGRKAFNVEPTP